ncbi:MAG: CerR family C-terminal domain-containing protein [Deltaproteobacteria bacterium]|nr:CerR family C-terminal domain-containing protein [Deltaproteobacteria bacterium]
MFAEHGYRGGAVREICGRANANVSAVAYHFGSKAALYEAVLRSTQEYAAERYPIDGLAALARTDAEGALHRFIVTFLRRLLDRGRPAWHGRLMTRELADPGPAFAVMVDEVAEPMFHELAAIVSQITGQPGDCADTRLNVASIMGQCSVHRSARALLAAMTPGTSLDLDALAQHITAFSLAGLRTDRSHAAASGASDTKTRARQPQPDESASRRKR